MADETSSAALLSAALTKILKPLARAMIHHGVTLPSVVQILKAALVEVAEERFGVDGDAPTDSRISVLTGVHRKDVKALRETARPKSEKTRNSILSTVVARWIADPVYRDRDGEPLALPRLAVEGKKPSFVRLVEAIASDVRPRTILDALMTQGLATLDEEEDTVVLNADALLPKPGQDEFYRYYQNNLHDHLAAATQNLIGRPDEDRFLERAVHYSHLSPEAAATVRAAVEATAMDSLRAINQLAMGHQDADRERDDASHRFRYGVYFYAEDEKDKDQ